MIALEGIGYEMGFAVGKGGTGDISLPLFPTNFPLLIKKMGVNELIIITTISFDFRKLL